MRVCVDVDVLRMQVTAPGDASRCFVRVFAGSAAAAGGGGGGDAAYSHRGRHQLDKPGFSVVT